jgi:molybdate transport system regulatory protein
VMRRKEIRVRCWVDVDGEKFFGPGRVELLEHILESGSIVKAAKAMNMSYKKAWDMVEELNARGKRPFVVTRKGGQEGGGAELTETGKRAVVAFRKLNQKIQDLAKKETELLKLI